MREFSINLSKALSKGLAPFPNNEALELGLRECFNLMPSPSGLVEHEALRSIGWYVPFFNYLMIRDQNSVLWYWYPVFDGHILVGDSVPYEPTTGLQPVSMTGTPVEWIEILDENGRAWQLYPSFIDGTTRATDSQITGTGIKGMIWRGTTGEEWMIKFNSATHERISVKV